jgi:hypothetical protein
MVKSLFADVKDGVWTISLGRLSFIVLFVMTLLMWSPLSQYEPADSQLDILIWLMMYNFGSKGIATTKEAIVAWKAGKGLK